ncbi:discoidin domain-containing protein [Rhizobium straminoryzae]|uniref:Discoidin domain-containing protein n=1 Tax=Rhizobium straminoryzae TaxID=1387186 RepID=A0A549SHP8_9HYPH|nr:discoidin domain-containing protein [Rhizobium straminoryzae]TRL29112.1 discoidin domain-containing protein [Rhizobium straminoryzae]
MQLNLRVRSASGEIKTEAQGADEAILVHHAAYEEGDSLELTASGPGHVWCSFDAALTPALLYLREPHFRLPIPFGEKRMPYAPQAFLGTLHRLIVRRADAGEIAGRRNLALNPLDQHANHTLFPRAEATVETRGEAQFAARNAIDGEKASFDHGSWPFTSWGINKDPEAAITVHFGRPVLIDEVVLYLRADFPHDAWWNAATVSFSDGSSESVTLEKTGRGQRFAIAPRRVEWMKLHSMIKADDPSPYPALTQIEAWGVEADG